MNKRDYAMAQQIAEAVSAFQQISTGHMPKSVSVVLSEDTLVMEGRPEGSPVGMGRFGQSFPRRVTRELIDTLLPEQILRKGVAIMSGKTDVVKGRVKEAAGALTGNDKLRAEGKTDQAVGKTKQAVQNVADMVKKAVEKVTG